MLGSGLVLVVEGKNRGGGTKIKQDSYERQESSRRRLKCFFSSGSLSTAGGLISRIDVLTFSNGASVLVLESSAWEV